MKRLSVCLAALGYLAVAAIGAPVFTDKGVDAGYLNPGDSAIVVQETEIRGDPGAATHLYAVTIRNDGTASPSHLTKLELRDGGNILLSIADLSGINTGGITVPLNYTIPAGATCSLKVLVWLAGTTAISGGETLKLALNYYYTLNGAASDSGWILDRCAEELVKAGFEKVEEMALNPAYFNPGNTGTVQVITWEDHDANASPIYISSLTVKNLESATQDDVTQVTVFLHANGVDLAPITLTDLSNWNSDGVKYVFRAPLMINDEQGLTCEIKVTISDTPTATRKIRTKVTLELRENGQLLEQASASPSTHTILMPGVEVVQDVSRLPEPRVVNEGGTLNQRILLQDDDANEDGVAIDRIRVWNSEDATTSGEELQEIAVYDARGLLGRVRDAGALSAFQGPGVEIPLSRPIVLHDDGRTIITISYTIADPVPGHTIRPKAQVWCDEARTYGWSPVAT
ncbi:MAG TPA: hypothetical protein ENF77_03250, partial [Candidatus Acetothermia bacterium]|nr:hypothetical protein [Candidatus Acetothermia bacterium]